MPIENSLSFKGLMTSPNNLGAGSEGALVVADNVTIRYPDVLEPRRGQAVAPITLATPAAVEQVFFFDDNVFVHTSADKIQRQDSLTALTGSYAPADPDYRLKTAVASSTTYMATDKGVMALESASSTMPRLSGIAEPLKPTARAVQDSVISPPTIPGFLQPGNAVAYRVLFGYVDSNNALHLGPPSVKVTTANPWANPASVNIDVPLLTAPTDANGVIIKGTFVRVYRSVMAATEGATSDELYLVNETVINTSEYGLDDTLILPDTASQDFAVQSAPLYTNATQGGLPNDPAPYARDLANWDSRLWFANTEQPYSLTAQLIGVEGGGTPTLPTTGIRVGDTITIAGVVFTGTTGEDPLNREFLVDSYGTPEENISNTLASLAFVVNAYAAANPTTFKIRAYLEPVVFSDQLFNFKIRFQRPSVDSTINTAFSVKYSVQTFTGVTVVAKVAGTQTVTTLVANQWKVDDFVQFRSTNPTLPRITAKVTTVVSPTVVRVTPVTVDVPTGYTRAQRLYGESVWTPDLSAGVAADNERLQNGLYYSNQQEPEAVSAANFLVVGTRGKAIQRIIPQRDRLLVFKEEGTYAVYGDFPYQVQLIDDTVQILAPDSAVAIGSTVIVLMDDGVMAVTDGGIQFISKAIDSVLKPYLSSTYRPDTATGTFGVSYESEKVFALFMPGLSGAGSAYTAKAYVYGMETNAWTTWSFFVTEPRLCGRVDPFTDTAYYGVATSPYLYKDRNTSSTADYFDTTPMGQSSIDATVQWATTTLGAPYSTKQAREIHLHFRDLRQPEGATLPPAFFSIKTDIVPAGQEIETWTPTEADSFSSETIVGPPALPLQFRKLVPQEVQRATYYTLGMQMSTVSPGGYWALNGYSIVFEGTSERTGTVR